MKSPFKLFSVCLGVVFLATPAFCQLATSPMLGDVTPSSARLWVKTRAAAKVQWVLSTNMNLSNPQKSKVILLEASHQFSHIFKVDGLMPETEYFYNVLINGKPVLEKPLPSFTTVPEDENHIRIAVTSCLGHQPSDSEGGWEDLASRHFDLLILLGDQHYADTTDPKILRKQYLKYRLNPYLQWMMMRKPVYAIWDDHDYGGDNSDGTLAGKKKSLAVFKAYWPNPSYGEEDNPGVYFSFARGTIEFFMLDGRYHRSPNTQTNDRSKTLLGLSQLEWLKRHLKDSKAKIKVIASSVEFNAGSYKQDNWSSFSHERAEILKFIADNKIQGVVFISGDSHNTAAFQMPEGFLEFTSGPLGSNPSPLGKNPHLLTGFDQGQAYAILDIDASLEKPVIWWEVYGLLPQGESEEIECSFDWPTILGQKKAQCPSAS
jgi:alkaline phosphatase D